MPGRTTGAAAIAVAGKLGRSFAGGPRLSDRAFWPTLVRVWRQPGGTGIAGRFGPVLYSGPLTGYRSSLGPPDLASVITAGCGTRLVRDLWMIVTGPRASPAPQAEFLFLDRDVHVLLYHAQ